MPTPTIHQLKRGLEIAEKIAALETEMSAIFAGKPATGSTSAPATRKGPRARKKHNLSPQAIANIRAAQKKRWAKFNAAKVAPKAASAPASPKPAPKKKSGFSQGHKAKLAAAAKKRWAAIKAGKLPNPFSAKK